jgi:hypothetical protein
MQIALSDSQISIDSLVMCMTNFHLIETPVLYEIVMKFTFNLT